MNDPNLVSREGERMAKPSANELQKAAEAVDLDGFDYEVTLETSAGPIRLMLDATNAPGHVRNLVALAENGFYDAGCFHRIIPGFMIQGGCPDGTGAGGPGYSIDCELDGDNQFHDKGVLSMAHAGRNTGGSQFFVCHSRNNTAHLDRNHTCFGKVYEGLDVINQIAQGDVIEKILIKQA